MALEDRWIFDGHSLPVHCQRELGIQPGIVNVTLAAQKSLLQVGGIYHVQGVSSPEVGGKASSTPGICRSGGAS
jgi:hypothetical protein